MNQPSSREASQQPLTPQQKRMIFLHEVDSANVAYNTGAAFRLRGSIDVERLRSSIAAVIQRHAILRTRFALIDGAPSAWLDAEPRFDWRVSERRREKIADAIADARSELGERMDLSRSTLRVSLIHVMDDELLLNVVMHHIVCDGWSFSLFIDAVCAEYGSDAKVEPPAAGAASYADYARWLASHHAGKSYARGVGHFVRSLAQAPLCLELSWDRPRPALQSYRGDLVRRLLPPGVVARATALAAERKVTTFTVFYSAYLLLLRCYSGQKDLVVGVPMANRQRSEFAGTIGFFVNTLPLRLRVDDDATGVDLLAGVHATLLDALDHQSAQIEDVIEALKLPRDASYSPIYQVLFAFQNAPAANLSLRAVQAQNVQIGSVGAKADLSLNLDSTDETLLASWEYNTDLFDRGTIERMASSYLTLLENLLAAPAVPLRELQLVSAPERAQLLAHWQERLSYPPSSCLRLIQEQAARRPTAPAIHFKAVVWTYAELMARSAALASSLSAAGVKPGDRVGVFGQRSPALVAALLATWGVGAAYVPLDPSYPPERLSYMLEDSGATVVLADDVTRVTAPGVRFIDLQRAIEEVPSAPLADPGGPSDLAYVIYTSGSTGRPKGVCIEHRSVVSFLTWAHQQYADNLSNVLASTSICFDLSVFEIFAPLTYGGALSLTRDALELAELPNPPPVKLLNLVHSALAELIRLGAVPKTARIVNFGGELPSNDTAQAAYALGHIEKAYNVYGPTEDTVYSMSYLIERGSTQVPAIGKSIPNSQACVLDEHGRLVPVGVTGELFLAGDGLARCYHARPELTAERFVEIDVGHKARAYRTGDLAKVRADGEIAFLGRRDHQVKVRGYRIELGEIDQALAKCSGVQAAASTTHVDSTGERIVVGYFVASDPTASRDRLRQELGQWLPSYMVPSQLIELSELPLTPNGKVARDRLPAPSSIRGTGGEPLENGLERTVGSVYAELLGASGVGPHDDFFALGGHSLLAARLAARLQRELGVDVTIRDVFRWSRVRALASELASRRPQSKAVSPLSVEALVAGGARPIELDEFAGYHVNCYYHCLLQGLSYFQKLPMNALNAGAAAFLPYSFRHATLDPGSVAAATAYRELQCITAQPPEAALARFGLSCRRFRATDTVDALTKELEDGGFPILVGDTIGIIEPSIAILGRDDDSRCFIALANDFGAGLKQVPFDSPRLRANEEICSIHPSTANAPQFAETWAEHARSRRATAERDGDAFRAWLGKYQDRRQVPCADLLRVELEGVNVTLGSELSGFLKFELFVARQLPEPQRGDRLREHMALIEQTLLDYQQKANALRRALLIAAELPPAAINDKIVDALQLVNQRQDQLARSLIASA